MNITEKTILVLLTGLTLTACNPSDMKKAKQNYACDGKGGVYRYVILGKTTCRDGSLMEWEDLILPPKYYPERENKHE